MLPIHHKREPYACSSPLLCDRTPSAGVSGPRPGGANGIILSGRTWPVLVVVKADPSVVRVSPSHHTTTAVCTICFRHFISAPQQHTVHEIMLPHTVTHHRC